MRLAERHQLGVLLDAGGAPGGEEVHEEPPAAVVGHGERPALGVGGVDRRRRLADQLVGVGVERVAVDVRCQEQDDERHGHHTDDAGDERRAVLHAGTPSGSVSTSASGSGSGSSAAIGSGSRS